MIDTMISSTSPRREDVRELVRSHRLIRLSLFSQLILACAVGVPATAFADWVPIQNPSFESPVRLACSFGGNVPGWSVITGNWNPGIGDQCAPLNGFPAGVPDGAQVGFVNHLNNPVIQVLAEVLQANKEYTLLVEVGRRSDGFPMIDYAVRLVANGMILAQDADELEPAQGTFLTSVVSFVAPANHPALGMPLEIHLVNIAGPQADFDNVRLFAGPYTPPLVGDINGDGIVNGADLGIILGSWGACALCNDCPADLTGDCVVDGADLGVLLGAWTG